MSFDSLPATIVNDLIEICDMFEAAGMDDIRPRIEVYLGSRPEPERTVLFEMLLGIELEMRLTAGERPEPREYYERFPADVMTIDKVFADGQPGRSTMPESPSETELLTAGLASTSPGSTIPVETGAACDSAESVAPERQRIGRYLMNGPLGRGNFQVYLARDDLNDRFVAIKVARSDVPASRRRLMSLADEAEKLEALEHPGIVKLYEYVPPGQPGIGADGYIVLEYVEGRAGEKTLEELLRAGPVPVLRLIRIAAIVAETLHYAHTHSSHLVHRDLKPSNILLDPRGEPRICDFGLTLDEEIQRLRMGEIAGTPSYMAPEQVRGETNHLDGRTDIWALGVILYRGLTGRLPFAGANQEQIFGEILHRDPRPLRMYDPGIEPELERIVLRCLARPMAERYLTAADLAADLKRAIDELPPQPSLAPDVFLPKGLRPFDVEDAGFFLALLPGPRRGDGMPESVRFWKDRIEASHGDKLFSVGVLYGPSGGGKTSFVKAGLLPNLASGRVRPVYLEAAPTGTESRLLAELHRAGPALPPDVNLPDAVAILRDDPRRRSAQKLFIVIDQFEQWLQAHPDQPDAELVRALRQCDGRRVQALVLVRDDFWMAVTRFLRALDVPLAQGVNAAAVELLDARHTRKVLEGFGQALGQLAEDGDTSTGEASRFLDLAARGLTGPDDRVIPMRLSLFTEVVRHRPWTPATLLALGGVDGIGVKFLDDCFASAQYKRHRGAAQAILKQLLPPPASVIRGAPRTGVELRAAAGYTDQPSDFAELVRVLDSELRLITAVDADGSSRAPDGHAPPPRSEADLTRYQVAHDFLVRPIRQWLERDQTSTREGRAKFRLELITASWLELRSPRRLPSTIELASILWHVPPSKRSSDEHLLIQAAQRHFLIRIAACAALLAGVSVGVKALRDRVVAAALLETSIHADYRNLAGMIPDLERYGGLLISGLEGRENHGSRPGQLSSGVKAAGLDQEHKREVAGILLYRFAPTPERGAYLRSLIRAAPEPDKFASIQDALAKHPWAAGTELLKRLLLDELVEPSTRLRAACVLARLDPRIVGESREAGAALELALMSEDRRTIPRWVKFLGPAARALVPALAKDCRDPGADSAKRTQVAEALADTLTQARDAEELARALVDSQPDAARILRRGLTTLESREAAVDYLRGVLNERPTDEDDEDRKDKVASRRAEAAITLAVLGETETLWPLLAHQPDPRLRARLIHTLADSGLPPRVLLDRLNRPGLEAAQRQAVLLALAEASPTGLTFPARAGFIEAAGGLFQRDPDPGVHSAAELLLRRWERKELLSGAVQAARTGPEPAGGEGRRWENGPNGHTFAILPGPLTFWMGSPRGEDGRADSEERQYRRIERSIEVATMEVTVPQFRAYKPEPAYKPAGRAAREPDVVANAISWYDAAGYCNWLSSRAKLPSEQWCYPRELKRGAKIEANALTRCGYRLPTEAEWEYFSRAGTETSRSFGGSDALLSRYAWTWLNSKDRTYPPGQLLPNEFGLFDTLGNVLEWCQDGPTNVPTNYQDPYPSGTINNPAPDVIRDVAVLNDDVWFYLRGASYESSPFKARTAFRDEGPLDLRLPRWGFRVVRTLPTNRR